MKHAKVFRLALMSDFLMVHSGRLSLLSVFFEILFCYIDPVFSVYAQSFLNYLNVKIFRNLEGALWEIYKKRRGTIEPSYFYVLAASGSQKCIRERKVKIL